MAAPLQLLSYNIFAKYSPVTEKSIDSLKFTCRYSLEKKNYAHAFVVCD